MRIEEINTKSLRESANAEVTNLRFRCIELFPMFTDSRTKIGDLTKDQFLEKYLAIRLEMKRRGLDVKTETPLDKEIKARLLKSTVYGLNVSGLGDLVQVENYISLTGSFVKTPDTANDVDVVIRDGDDRRDESLELKLSRLIQGETGKKAHFIYSPRGPHSNYIPVFDLILRSRPDTRKVEVKERELSKKLSPAQQKEVDAESEKIRANKETSGAQKPHKFRPAEWTHPNGHPRCLLCGMEEPIYDECCGLAMEGDQEAYQAFYDRLTAERGDEGRLGKVVQIRPGSKFTPLKTKGGYGELEFSSVEPAWTEFAQGYIPDPGVAVETKYDGFRSTIHKDGDKVEIQTEDAHRDLAGWCPDVVKEVQGIKASTLVLDSELMIFVNGKKIERKDMGQYLCQHPIAPFKATCAVFDVLYIDGEPLNKLTWLARQEYLDHVFAGKDELNLKQVQPTICKTEAAFRAAVKKHAGEPHSEGAMLKVITSDYPLSGSTPLWAKIKNFKEIRCRVMAREAADGKGYRYDCEIEGGAHIGKTYSSEVEAQVGDVIEVVVAEVKYDEAEDKFTWDNPIPRSLKPKGTALTTKEQALAFVRLGRTQNILAKLELDAGDWAGQLEKAKEFGNISFDQGDSGDGIAQVHMMGFSEEEIVKVQDANDRIMVARLDLLKLGALLHSLLGPRGAHIDMRLKREKDSYFEGNELFVGDLDGFDKLVHLKTGKPVRMAWKQSRVGEPREDVIQGPLGWMQAGSKKVEVFPPGEAGATSQKFGFMVQIDKYKWSLYYVKDSRHAYKFHFEGGRIFNGNWLFSAAPIGEGGARVWLVSILDPDDHTQPQPQPKEAAAFFKFTKVDKKLHLVGGIIYEPDVADTQGDWADEGEIEKAKIAFMEKYAGDTNRIKIMHKGKPHFFPIIECFQPEHDTKKGKDVIKAGAWWLEIRVKDADIWQEIESGKLGGFSMGGRAAEDESAKNIS
jgi:hypothetical protein